MGTPYGVSNAGVCRTEHHCVCQPSEICDNTLVLHFRDCSFATIKQERLYSVRGETYRQNHRRAKPQRDALQKSTYPKVVTGGGGGGRGDKTGYDYSDTAKNENAFVRSVFE